MSSIQMKMPHRIVKLFCVIALLTGCQNTAPTLSEPVPSPLPMVLLTPALPTRPAWTSVPVHLEFLAAGRLIRVEAVQGGIETLSLPTNAAAFWVDSGSRGIIFGFAANPVFDILAAMQTDQDVLVTDQHGYRDIYRVASRSQSAALDEAIKAVPESGAFALIGVPLTDEPIQIVTLRRVEK
jgi:hypothetical protein